MDVETGPRIARREIGEIRRRRNGGDVVETVEEVFAPQQPAVPAQVFEAATHHIAGLGLEEAHRGGVAVTDGSGVAAGVTRPGPGGTAGEVEQRRGGREITDAPTRRGQPF